MKQLAIVIFLTIIGSLALAEPFVIYDAGQGVSTASYTRLFSGEEIPDFKDSWLFKELPEADAAGPTPQSTFPISTTRLSPRRITEEKETYFAVMAFPLCVIGTDDLSRLWLERNLRHLVEMNAHCLLVSAESEADARSLLELTPGLAVYPAHGDAIADYFKIEHYPVLITHRSISQ